MSLLGFDTSFGKFSFKILLGILSIYMYIYIITHVYNLFYAYFIDELAEVALALLPFLLPQKRNKSNQEEFVRFISVRVH